MMFPYFYLPCPSGHFVPIYDVLTYNVNISSLWFDNATDINIIHFITCCSFAFCVGNGNKIVGNGNKIVGGGGSGGGRGKRSGNESSTRTRGSAGTEESGTEAWGTWELKDRDLG